MNTSREGFKALTPGKYSPAVGSPADESFVASRLFPSSSPSTPGRQLRSAGRRFIQSNT